MISSVAAFTLACGVLLAAAGAAPVSMRASGSVTMVGPLAGGGMPPAGIALHDPVMIEWSYDSDATGISAGTGQWQYVDGLNLEVSVRINALEWAGSGSWALVGNLASIDFLSFEARSSSGAVYSSFPGMSDSTNTIAFNLADHTSPTGFLSLLALPAGASDADLASLNAGANTNGFITAQNFSGTGWQVRWDIDPASVEFVAGPGALVLEVGVVADGSLDLLVGNVPEGRTFHLRSSTDGVTFTPLSPALDFDSVTAQPLSVAVDPGAQPVRVFQVFEGPSP